MPIEPNTLLYFAPVPWDSYPQRPHYFIQHFLKHAVSRVAWVDPYPTRLPTIRDLAKTRRGPHITLDRPAGLTVISVRALPLEPLAIGRWLSREFLYKELMRRLKPLIRDRAVVLGIGRPSSLALAALTQLRPSRSFYDAMDDFPEFYRGISRKSVIVQEREIVRGVDVILTSSSALWNKFAHFGSRRVMVHNAFDMAALPRLTMGKNGRHVFGYVGCIGAWFDWSITVQLARSFGDAAVHVVGPCFAKPPRDLPANVTLFPACPIERAIE